jgi:dynactin complex subunit
MLGGLEPLDAQKQWNSEVCEWRVLGTLVNIQVYLLLDLKLSFSAH